MAFTKYNFYLSLLFLTLVVFIGLSLVGTELSSDPDIVLDEKSYDYILQLHGMNNNNSYTEVSERDAYTTGQKGILDADDNASVSDDTGFLGTLFIKKERASQSTNFFKLVYNLPTTILIGLGLPVSPFVWLNNIIAVLLFTSLLIMVWVYFIRT